MTPPAANAPAAPVKPSMPQSLPSAPVSAPSKVPDSIEQSLAGAAEKHFAAAKPAAEPANTEAKVEPKVEPAKADKPAATPEAKTEAKPATAPAPDADPFAHIKPDDGMSEKSLTGWKALKKEASDKVAALTKQHADALAQLETFKKATPAQTEDAERLKTELKQARDALAVYDLRHDPDFTRQYSEPKKKALAEASMLLTDNAVESPDIKALLDKPRAEFAKVVSELASKLPDFDKGSLVASMREAYRLHGEENGALTKAGELKQQIESKRALEARRAFDETRTEFTTKVPELTIPEGASEDRANEIRAYNAARTEALAEAERYSFNPMNERQVAQVAQQAAAMKVVAQHIIPSLTRERDQALALNRELAAELAGIKAGKKAPGFNEGATPSKGPDYSKLPPEKAFEAMAESHFRR